MGLDKIKEVVELSDKVGNVSDFRPNDISLILKMMNEFKERSVNVKTFGASGSIQTTTGSIASGTNTLTVASAIDFEKGQGIRVMGAKQIQEVRSLVVNTSATSSTTLRIYFDETFTDVSVTNGDSATTVAGKIRAATFTGWTTGGSGTTVTFTANSGGKRLFYFVGNSTGVSAAVTTTTAGESDLSTVINDISGTTFTLRDNSTTTVSGATVHHDDTEAISAAIDSISKGRVVFPSGDYNYRYINKVKSNLSFEGLNATLISYALVGDGVNSFHILGSNIRVSNINFKFDRVFNYDNTFKPSSYPGGNNHFRLGGDRAGSANPGWQENLIVENCTFDGGYAGGIDVYYANNVVIKNNKVTNTLGNGINFSNCQRDILVEKNTVENTRDDMIQNVCDAGWLYLTVNYVVRNNRCKNTYAKGISTTGADGVIFEGNYVENTWGGGMQPFYDSFYNLGRSRNVIVKDNVIVNAGKNYGAGKYKTSVSSNADGIYISAETIEVMIENNRIYSPYRYGINILNGAKDISIKRNRIRGAGSTGILIGDVADVTYSSAYEITITENNIKDSTNYGISIGGVNEGVISGNKIKSWGNSNYPIYIKNCAYITADNNIVNDAVTDKRRTSTYYTVGSCVVETATDAVTHVYKCTTEGLTGTSTPSFPATSGATVSDGEVVWTEIGTGSARGLTSNIVRVEGTNISVTSGKDNRLLNTSSDYPNNCIVISDRKIAYASGKPTSGIWKDRDVVFDTAATAGGKVGYWCYRGGRAGTTWAASTAYTVGQYVVPTSDNGYAYKCVTAGTSGGSAPTWGTTVGGQTTDGTAVWENVGTSALFKQWGVIDA